MTMGDYLQAAFAFGFVLALIALAALAARRIGLGHAPTGPGQRRLTLRETASIDARHKLVLLRRDDVEHLVVLGPNGATVLETGIDQADQRRVVETTRPPPAAAPVSRFAAALGRPSR